MLLAKKSVHNSLWPFRRGKGCKVNAPANQQKNRVLVKPVLTNGIIWVINAPSMNFLFPMSESLGN